MKNLMFIIVFILTTFNIYGKCYLGGKFTITPELDYQRAYFILQPYNGCNGFGLGLQYPDSIIVNWGFYCKTTQSWEIVQAKPTDTIDFYTNGMVIVTCEVQYYKYGNIVGTYGAGPNLCPLGISIDCFELLSIPIDTIDTTTIDTITTIPILNFSEYTVEVSGGILKVSGQGVGHIVILDWNLFNELETVTFNNSIEYALLPKYYGYIIKVLVIFDNGYSVELNLNLT